MRRAGRSERGWHQRRPPEPSGSMRGRPDRRAPSCARPTARTPSSRERVRPHKSAGLDRRVQLPHRCRSSHRRGSSPPPAPGGPMILSRPDADEGIEPAVASAVAHEHSLPSMGPLPVAAARFSTSVLYSLHNAAPAQGTRILPGSSSGDAQRCERRPIAAPRPGSTARDLDPDAILSACSKKPCARRDRQLTSRLSLAGDSTIRRHVSFHCEQGTPQREQPPLNVAGIRVRRGRASAR